MQWYMKEKNEDIIEINDRSKVHLFRSIGIYINYIKEYLYISRIN